MAKIKLCILFIFLIMVFDYKLPSACAEGIDMGVCNLYPMIKVMEKYEDNVFQLPYLVEGDYSTTTTPELLLKFKLTDRNIFNIDYKYEINEYNKFTSGNRKNSKFNTVLELYGAEYFLKAKEDFSKNTVVTSYATVFDDYDLNDAMLTLGREMDRVSYEFSYENLIYDYKTIDDPNNYVEHTLSFTGYYKFFPKTKALIEYDFSKFNYENDSTRSADANQILTGLKGDLTAKLTGTIKVGYQDRKYKNNQDWKKPVTYLNLTYDVSEKTSLNVTAQRTVYESVYTVQNYFEEDSLQCLISQKLTAKTTASLSGLYARDMYPVTSSTDTTRRSDDIWDAKLTIDAKTRRWFNLGVSYEFSRRSSNLPINDYNDNIMSVYAKAMY